MWLESDLIPYQAANCCPAGTALVLAPHPDDEIFGCGGAIMRHLAAGDPVKVIILTDSDYGCFADGVDKREARRREALAAAAILGYGQPAFWGLPDRGLSYDEALIGRLLAAIMETGATILYSPSWWEIHPDHGILALAAVEALRRCDRPLTLAMYEVGVPLHPNLLLDITDLAERKRAAMACFVSQLAMQAYDTQIMALHQFRTYTLPGDVRFAEAFRLMDQEALRRDPLRAVRPGLYYSRARPATELAQPLVSLLYLGCRAGLDDALDSAMIQTHSHLEVIVVQEPGADEAAYRGELTAWGRGSFPVIMIEGDGAGSLGEKANRAMARARGVWLLLLEDGDALAADHVASLVATLGAASPARCACGGVRWERQGEEWAGHEWRLPPEPRGPEAYLALPSNACLFARSLVEEGCQFDPDLEDEMARWDFWMQLTNRTRWVTCPGVSATHRDLGRGGAAQLSWNPEAASVMTLVIGRWLDRLPKHEGGRFHWEALRRAEQATAEAKAWQARVKSLEARLEEASSARHQALDNLTASTLQLTELRRLQTETAAQCDELRRHIDALHASSSWQWTYPLRVMGGWLRQARMAWRRF